MTTATVPLPKLTPKAKTGGHFEILAGRHSEQTAAVLIYEDGTERRFEGFNLPDFDMRSFEAEKKKVLAPGAGGRVLNIETRYGIGCEAGTLVISRSDLDTKFNRKGSMKFRRLAGDPNSADNIRNLGLLQEETQKRARSENLLIRALEHMNARELLSYAEENNIGLDGVDKKQGAEVLSRIKQSLEIAQV